MMLHSHSKLSKFAICAALALLATGTSRAARAQVATEWSGGHVIYLGGLPGSVASYAFGVNNARRVAGYSIAGNSFYAAEWSGGKVIDLRGLPGYSNNQAYGINNAGPIWPGRGHIPELHRSIF
jgi:uncharacterized membrane protein